MEIRKKDRAITDKDAIERIFAEAKVMHLGLIDGDYPYVVPLHYGYEKRGDSYVLYAHGAKEGHKLDLVRANPHACVELECGGEIASGGDVPCGYDTYYSSVIARGQASVIEDTEEKIHAAKLLMKTLTGRDFEFSEKMVSSIAIIKIEIEELTAKSGKK